MGMPAQNFQGNDGREDFRSAMERFFLNNIQPRQQPTLFQSLMAPTANAYQNFGGIMQNAMNQQMAMNMANQRASLENKAIKAPVAAQAIKSSAIANALGGRRGRDPGDYINNIGQSIRFGG